MLGGLLTPRALTTRKETAATIGAAVLDAASAAHEATLRRLVDHMARRGAEVRAAPGRGPQFDAGWVRESTTYIAEVKSLTGAVEAQQIRLGLGQVLDYSHSIRCGSAGQGLTVVPALVLQREPAEERWASLALSLGVVLTWPPNFPGV